MKKPYLKALTSAGTLALAIGTLAVTPACYSTPDCSDPSLIGSYEDGKQAARDKGYADGLALTYEQGHSEGYNQGYNAQYDVGYYSAGGYDSGYAAGYDNGYTDGRVDQIACDDGAALGDQHGYEDGIPVGEYDGFQDGYSDGYDYGFSDGLVSCGSFSEPEDRDYCYNQGYRSTSAYQAGLAQGKSENSDYQTGKAAGRAEGESAGFAAGQDQGYADGYAVGDLDGFNDGADEAYLDCYDQAYAYAYADGYEDGYNDLYNGYGEAPALHDDACAGTGGFGAGYCDGFNDGYDVCLYGSEGSSEGLTLRQGTSEAWKKANRRMVAKAFPNGVSTATAELLRELRDFESESTVQNRDGGPVSRKLLRNAKRHTVEAVRGEE